MRTHSISALAILVSATILPPLAPLHEQALSAQSYEATRRDSLIWERDELLSHFEFSEDRIEGGGWYTHLDQSVDKSFDRVYLDAPMDATGRAYLRSNYFGPSWIFHDRVVVRIGSRVLRSEVMPFNAAAARRTAASSGVFEDLHFTTVGDGGILAAIARTNVGDTVLVRLEGAQHQFDYDLTERDRAAIAETVRLSTLLKSVGRTAVARHSPPAWVGYAPESSYFAASKGCATPSTSAADDWHRFKWASEAERIGYHRGTESECVAYLQRPPQRVTDSIAAATRAKKFAALEAYRDSVLRVAKEAEAAEAKRIARAASVNDVNPTALDGWVAADARRKIFFKPGCDDDGRDIIRITFTNASFAVSAGYERSKTPGC